MEVTQFTIAEFEAYKAANPKPEFKSENRKKAFEQFEKSPLSKTQNIFKVRVMREKEGPGDVFEFVLEKRITQDPSKEKEHVPSNAPARKSQKDFEREKNARRPRSLLILDIKTEMLSLLAAFGDVVKQLRPELLELIEPLSRKIQSADLSNNSDLEDIENASLFIELAFRQQEPEKAWAVSGSIRLINALLTVMILKKPLFDVNELKYLHKKITKAQTPPPSKTQALQAHPPAQA